MGQMKVDDKNKNTFLMLVTAMTPFPIIAPENPWIFYISSEKAIQLTGFEQGPPN
jgi:hypothetical protein